MLILVRAVGSGFNCNLDITRSFHLIINYLFVIVLTEWKVGHHLEWRGGGGGGHGEDLI